MPILRVKEIRDLSHEERRKRLRELQTELVRLKTMIKAGGSVENPARVRQLRKAIARILTIESQPEPMKEEKKKKPKPKKKKKKTEEASEGTEGTRE